MRPLTNTFPFQSITSEMTAKIGQSPKYTRKVKDFLDRVLGWLAFLSLSPLLWALAALIRLDSPGPALFRQERIGQSGRPFVAIKFRSMVDKATTMGLGLNVASNDFRITRVGRFLRNTSLDELPQLFHVLNGEMSLVGPRPTLPYQVAAYDAFQRRRLEVKPGITGWAQVNGRNAIPWEERIKLDVWYVDHWSLSLDLAILFRTLKVWTRQEGLYGPAGVNYDLASLSHN
jgi:lipopolysaccharide/colanic/teichoic acid biosynthesis glycosyltransferase